MKQFDVISDQRVQLYRGLSLSLWRWNSRGFIYGFPSNEKHHIDQYQSDENSLSSVKVLSAQQTKPSEACKGGVREDESLGRHKPDLIDAHDEKHVHAVTYRQFT